MIIRIMGLGQWSLEPEQLIALNEFDEAVEQAVTDGDQDALRVALEKMVLAVQSTGAAVPDDVIVESDLVLPDPDATVDEVKTLLDSTQEFYGLLPDAHEGEDPRP